MFCSKTVFLFFLSIYAETSFQTNGASEDFDINMNKNSSSGVEPKMNILAHNITRMDNNLVKEYVERKQRSQEKQFLVGTPQGPALAVRRPFFPVRLSPAMAFLIPAIPTLLGKKKVPKNAHEGS